MQLMDKLLADERKRLVRQIRDELPARAGTVAIIGELKMGKTLILKALKDAFQEDSSHPAPLTYISMRGIRSEDDFYSAVVAQLIQFRSNLDPGASTLDFRQHLAAIINRLSAHLQSLTIIMDDADVLQEYDWGARLFRRLAAFLDENARVHFIVSGTHRLLPWAQSMQVAKGLWEHLLRPPIVLGALPDQMIRDTVKSELAQRLIQICGGHPFLLARLTATIQDTQSLKAQIASLELADLQFKQADEGGDTFQTYWESYSILSRQLCYLLAMKTNGYQRDDLVKLLTLDGSSIQELDAAIDGLQATGVLRPNTNGWLQLIDIFRSWYQSTIGYVEVAPLVMKSPVTSADTKDGNSLTELIFLPKERTVIVKQGHYLQQTELGMDPDALSQYITRSNRVPDDDPGRFMGNLNNLTWDLWVAFSKTEWLKHVIASYKEQRTLRFYIPPSLMEFPFEMLPLDNTGTRRIGTEVAVSRQIFEQGQEVDLEPLCLPLPENRPMKILVIISEIPKSFWLDFQSKVQLGAASDEPDAPIFDGISLKDEARGLYKVIDTYGSHVGDVTYLSPHTVSGSSITWAAPTLNELISVLQKEQFDLIHYVGHALFSHDPNARRGLILQDELLSLDRLRDLLKKQNQLRFIYLSCCESGRMNTNIFSSNLLGVAQTCIDAGIPAVLSMRWQIPTGVSKRLTESFYPAFFQSGRLELATLDAINSLHDDLAMYSAAPILLMH